MVNPDWLRLCFLFLFLFFLFHWCAVEWRNGNRRRVVAVLVLACYALSYVFRR